ncbi:MAG: hypothetical protein JO279_02950 [Verrucomicrobia bacterium]|nr:hypothetical protein [Verrucomicrobiota bacterium]
MFRGHIAGTPVINPDQVVSASPWVWQSGSIQQHHRDAGSLKRKKNAFVGLITRRSPLQRSKEHSMDLFRDVLLAKLPGLLILRLFVERTIAPKKRMFLTYPADTFLTMTPPELTSDCCFDRRRAQIVLIIVVTIFTKYGEIVTFNHLAVA